MVRISRSASWRRVLHVVLAMLASMSSLSGQAAPVRVDAVEAELVADVGAVRPGQPFRLGLRLLHDPHWHTYWRNPGDSGLPTTFDLVLPAGTRVGEIEWPAPVRVFIPPLANYGYEDEVVLPRQVELPADFAASTLQVEASASWLVCRDVCIPGEAKLTLSIPVLHAGQGAAPGARQALFAAAARRTPGEPLAVDLAIDDRRLSIVVPAARMADGAGKPEYFPYHEGLVANAAAQRVYRLADGARRIEVELSPDAQPPLSRAAEGIVVTDTQVIAIRAGRTLGRVPAGELVATIAGAESAPPPDSGPAGAANRLLDAARSGSGSGGFAAQARRAASPTSIAPTSEPAHGGSASPRPGGDVPRSVWIAIVLAFVGGVILNLMPCVFPVIGLKILGFAGQGGAGGLDAAQRRRLRAHTLWFAAGVLVSFWMLAGALLALRAGGQSVGWGFQLQSPAFVSMMTLLFVAIGLNLSGVYEVGASMTRLGGIGGGGVSADAHASSTFGTGILAVLVATPCTAPFMGSALGFTLGESPLVAFAVFTGLGAGMAAPYAILGLMPGWLRLLPRPGRWMESLREALAFPMYAAAAWLAWVLGQQAGGDAVLAVALAAVLLAFAAWLWGRFVQHGDRRRRVPVAALAILAALGALTVAWPAGDPDASMAPHQADGTRQDWAPWSAARVERALAEGRPVFVDFTAAWCVTCQANKKLVLRRESIASAFAARRVVTLQADWTRRDPEITAELARFGRNGVPLYLLYLPGVQHPVLLPEILSTQVVLDALEG